MGAEAIRELLREIDLVKFTAKSPEEFKETTGQKAPKAINRLEVVKPSSTRATDRSG